MDVCRRSVFMGRSLRFGDARFRRRTHKQSPLSAVIVRSSPGSPSSSPHEGSRAKASLIMRFWWSLNAVLRFAFIYLSRGWGGWGGTRRVIWRLNDKEASSVVVFVSLCPLFLPFLPSFPFPTFLFSFFSSSSSIFLLILLFLFPLPSFSFSS